jgi:hypothetical protein
LKSPPAAFARIRGSLLSSVHVTENINDFRFGILFVHTDKFLWGKHEPQAKSTSRPLLVCLLSDHSLRILVLRDSKKNRLAKTVISCPLREFYLADHHWLDPVASLHLGSTQPTVPFTPTSRRKVEKRTTFDPNL